MERHHIGCVILEPEGPTGRTVVLVAVVQQLLPLPLVLLGTPQLPCNNNEAGASAESSRKSPGVFGQGGEVSGRDLTQDKG